MPSSLQLWATIASAGAAWIALVLSIINARTSRRALWISEQQEARRQPQLALYLQEGYVSLSMKPDARVYAFLISVSNRSDSDNAIAEIVLRLTYIKAGSTEFTVKTTAASESLGMLAAGSASHFRAPIRIDAHQTMSGWCFFAIDNVILGDARIERTVLAFLDTHGNESTVEPLIVREHGHVSESSRQADI